MNPESSPESSRSTKSGFTFSYTISIHTMKLLPACLLMVLFCFPIFTAHTHAQDFEDWLRQEQKEYEDYRAEQNSAFADMLRRQWEAMTGEQPRAQLEEEKPAQLPVAEPAPEPESEAEPAPEPDPQPKPEPEPETVPEPPSPPITPEPEEPRTPSPRRPSPEPAAPPPDVDPSLPAVSVNFYGLSLRIPYDTRLTDFTIPDSYDAEKITEFWEKMSETDIESAVDFYQEIQKQTQINDWGLARLMFAAGKEIFDGNRDQARLYTWFMLIQNGYKARTGFNDQGIKLLLASESHIYGTPFYRFDDVPFFLAHFDKPPAEPERLLTYRSDFPGDLKPLSLGVRAIPRLDPDYHTRDLSFEFKGETIDLQVEIDRNLIAFYQYFPQTDLGIYFDAPVTESTAGGLVGALAQHVEGRSEKEAVHLLLRFVQTAFGYKIDPENFGREKPLFPEETIYYDYSDCEDRAILFSFLVRELTGLDVVGLRYPGHIATAVRFNETLTGDTVDVRGETFLVCDPTYINAGPGMTMNRYKDTVPEIIPIRH